MIPLHILLSGFLSYREPVDIDFTTFELACIAGSNGAGKSSLLDAITWALFGQARKRDDSIINSQSTVAQVCLTFSYEDNVYRILRRKERDKTAMLEFQILQDAFYTPGDNGRAAWKTLSEPSLRGTEARIQQTLRMDYETFVNAAFFLQGKADQFTQQRSGDRKRILGSILGLEIWETYRQRALERRRGVENDIARLDGSLRDIVAELDDEKARKERLKELESDLERLSRERLAQESALDGIRKLAASLAARRREVDSLTRNLDAALRRLDELEKRTQERCLERDAYAGLLSEAGQIEAAFAAWQASREALERWEGIAARFREHEKRREGPRDEINTARAELSSEMQLLLAQQQQIEAAAQTMEQLQTQVEASRQAQEQAEAQLALLTVRDAERLAAQQFRSDTAAENKRLKAEMDELKGRIKRVTEMEGVECPFCGQPLNPAERQKLIEDLNARGKEMGDHYRTNQALLVESEARVADLEQEIEQLKRAEGELRTHAQALAQYSSQLELLEKQQTGWLAHSKPRLDEISLALRDETFAPAARLRLAEIDAELKAIGYDAAAHDGVRQAELEGRSSEAALRELEKARATLTPLNREIEGLQEQIAAQQVDVARQQEEQTQAVASLAADEAQAPDLYGAEKALLELQEQENRLRLEVGAARQKVLVLGDLKARRKKLEAEREEMAAAVGQYKQLERAFGKDGVPALLIEQALPQIEDRTNEILDRLSGGNMSVRFVTQVAYKEKRREDLKETLDIQISDGSGTRDYEMFSGGEAFRVNFAIRLALSEVLAQRAGARLQTLVVDEGFGSQDSLGRQRLVEAINLVRADFAKILVITHIDELKDAFPNRIEVEKTDRGSVVRVV